MVGQVSKIAKQSVCQALTVCQARNRNPKSYNLHIGLVKQDPMANSSKSKPWVSLGAFAVLNIGQCYLRLEDKIAEPDKEYMDVRKFMKGDLDAKLNGSTETLEEFYNKIEQFVDEIQKINSEESNTVVIVVSREHLCFIEQLISKQGEKESHLQEWIKKCNKFENLSMLPYKSNNTTFVFMRHAADQDDEITEDGRQAIKTLEFKHIEIDTERIVVVSTSSNRCVQTK